VVSSHFQSSEVPLFCHFEGGLDETPRQCKQRLPLAVLTSVLLRTRLMFASRRSCMLVSLSAALSPLLQRCRASLLTKEVREVNFCRDTSWMSCSGNPRDRVMNTRTPIVELIVFAGTLQDVARQEVPDRNLHLRRNSESFFYLERAWIDHIPVAPTQPQNLTWLSNATVHVPLP
jgi:hypothetical protein